MSDFKFLQNPVTKKWVISALRRAKRPDIAHSHGAEPVCPFCPGREGEEAEVYRVSGGTQETEARGLRGDKGDKLTQGQMSDPSGSSSDSDWLVRVIPNKFPFATIHEVVVHSPDHHKGFGELSVDHAALVLQTYRQRYLAHKDSGEVYIFHNRGEAGGESLPHPHSQIAVVPLEMTLEIPPMNETDLILDRFVESERFYVFCPDTSQWPDEIWIAPKRRDVTFGDITDEETVDLATTVTQLVDIFDLRHGHELPFNFYIYPGQDWYLRIIPRVKVVGGFEVGTQIFVNTQDPKETFSFIREHFETPDHEKIRREQRAEYSKHS